MARKPEIRAAGGVLRRIGSNGDAEIAVIHRPKYDDWSLPKGKLDPGEDFQDAAVREVEEETGLRVSVGREIGDTTYRDRNGRRKLVRYWLMTPLGGRFLPDQEVDRLEWLPAGAAQQRLSYERDREILGELDGAPPAVREEAPPAPPARAEPEAAEAPRADGRRNPPPEYLYARKWRIFAVTMVGLFMALIDITIVNITIPTLQRKLHAGVDTVSWVLNAYNIMFAVLLVSMGRLADQFGRKRFFLIGMSIFTVGSLLCALSPTIHALIGFRVVQAVGAGILAPLALATAAIIFPPHQRGLGLALLAVVANAAAAIGPPLGGILVQYASWHWIFLINVPIGIIGVLLATRVMPETYDLTAGRQIDLIGMTLLGGSVAALTYALVEANNKGWGSTEIVSLFVVAAVLGVGFAVSQRKGRFPMLTRALTHNRQFTGASLSFVLFAMGVMGVLFLMVLAFQNMWGYSSLDAAFAISPIPIVGLIVAPLVSRVADRLQPRIIGCTALFIMACGLFWASHISAHRDYLGILPALILMGVGMGAAFPSLSVGSMGSVPGQEVGLASGIVNMSRQLGFALGIAVLVAVFTGAISNNIPKATARAAQVTKQARLPPARQKKLIKRAFANPNQSNYRRFVPHTRIQRAVGNLAAHAARDSFSDAFRVAALCELLAIPFALTMRRSPQQIQEAAAGDG
ncbi:MAG: DHA2 family efflux MFS transporter permease subunit [Actinobacteria bacterium]|nr:MAG: DHA2 family efflux MFS transporter permease subunit [Actinomycetota bacterium]